ncbi:MAG: hypothetical protein KGL39_05335 [Patescibacteria group bacterium]|nr:hypothetical protein [Patescibacteria group bacterium]
MAFAATADDTLDPLTPARPRSLAGAMIAPRPAPAYDPISTYMAQARKRESSGNDNASSGVADGRYQFTPDTWMSVGARHPELGLAPGNIYDPAKQEAAMRAFTADNAAILQKNGVPVTPTNLYVMHFLGEGAGPTFLRAMGQNPTAPAAQFFPKEARYNPTIFYHGGDPSKPKSLSEIYAGMSASFGGGAAAQPVQVAQADTGTRSDAVVDAKPAEVDLPPELVSPPTMSTSVPSINVPPSVDLPDDLKSTAGQTDAQGVYHPAAKETPQSFVDRVLAGLKGSTVAKEFGEWSRGEIGPETKSDLNQVLGFGSGIAQGIGGIGELLPNFLGGDLAAKADKDLQNYGDKDAQSLGRMAPMLAPIGEGAAAVKAGSEALRAGADLLPMLGKGLVRGGVPAAMAGAATPTGETDQVTRAKEKAVEAAKVGSMGAALGAAGPAVMGAGKMIVGEAGKIPKFFSDLFGKELKQTAAELRTGVDAKTGKALTEEEKAAKLASIDKAVEKARSEKEIADEKAVIETHAQRNTAPPEQLGDEAQKTAVEDMKALKDKRREESGFNAAVKSDGGKPSVRTDAFVTRAKQMAKNTRDPELQKDLNWLKNALKTPSNVKGGPTVKAVSIKQVREIVEQLDKRIDNLGQTAAHDLKAVRDDLIAQMEKQHPAMALARKKYAELSRDLDVYERSGVLSKAVKEDPYSGEAIADPTAIKRAITGKSQAGADALERLIKKNPKLKDTARDAFNHELFGSGAAKKPPTVSQMTTFLKNNRLALEKSGIYDEFAKLKTEREAVIPNAERDKSIKDLAKQKADALASRQQFATFQTELKAARTPQEIASVGTRVAKALVKDGKIPQKEYESMLNQIKDVEEHASDHARARSLAAKIAIWSAISLGVGGEIGNLFSHRINVR